MKENFFFFVFLVKEVSCFFSCLPVFQFRIENGAVVFEILPASNVCKENEIAIKILSCVILEICGAFMLMMS
jgi:hypothetical protein